MRRWFGTALLLLALAAIAVTVHLPLTAQYVPPYSLGTAGLGTGVATALALNVGSPGAPLVNGGALGIPSSGTLTYATGLPIATGVAGLGTGIASALAVNTGTDGAPAIMGNPSVTVGIPTGIPGAQEWGMIVSSPYGVLLLKDITNNVVPFNIQANSPNCDWFMFSTGDVALNNGCNADPAYGLYIGAAGSSGYFHAGNFSVNASGNTVLAGLSSVTGIASGGTKFTISGCSAGTTVGGATAGQFASGTSGACPVVITMNGATGLTAPNGWSCFAADITAGHLVDFTQTASSQTTCTVSATTTSGDTVVFHAIAY